MAQQIFEFNIDECDVGKRIDVFIAENIDKLSRSAVKNLMEEKLVEINGRTAKPNNILKCGDVIKVILPEVKEVDIVAQDIAIDIVYEDEDVAVINKPKGMVVHPAAGNPDNTLVNAILFHIKDLSGINGELRPGIVHRLDKDTSGLIIIAKNDESHRNLSEQIKNKTAKRQYVLIAHGNIKEDEFTVDKSIARSTKDRKMMEISDKGRNAKTHFKVLERFGDFCLLQAELETGRTHQIRVHMKSIGHPLAGDTVYGPKKTALSGKGQLLCARKIGFIHPRTNEEMNFSIDVDEEFERVLKNLRKKQKN